MRVEGRIYNIGLRLGLGVFKNGKAPRSRLSGSGRDQGRVSLGWIRTRQLYLRIRTNRPHLPSQRFPRRGEAVGISHASWPLQNGDMCPIP